MDSLDALSDAISKGADTDDLRSMIARQLLRDLHQAEPEAVTKAIAEIAIAAGAPMALAEYEPQVIDGSAEHVCKQVGGPAEEQRTVFGVVLEPDGVDSQGDTIDRKSIEETAHLYLTDYRNIGHQHKALVNNKVKLLESYIAPIDMVLDGTSIKAGTWLMKVRIEDDELWHMVKTGELTGFSIAGFATRTPLAA